MKIKFFTIIIIIFTTLLICNTHTAVADALKALEIMKKVGEQKKGDDMKSEMEMILIDKHRKKRVRQMVSYSKKKGADNLAVSFFINPADVKGTGFLSYAYSDPSRDDDQWLYMPSLRKTKRISSSSKGGSFMGSDFSYSDMGTINIKDFNFAFYKKRQKVVKGKKCWVIWGIPKTQNVVEETGYTKSISFVRQDNYNIIRAIFYSKDGSHAKYMDVKKLEQIDGIWVPSEVHMSKKLGKKTVHKTILRNKNTKFNQNLSYDLFTIRRLEKGL